MTAWSAFPGELNSHRHFVPHRWHKMADTYPQSSEEGQLRDDQ